MEVDGETKGCGGGGRAGGCPDGGLSEGEEEEVEVIALARSTGKKGEVKWE